MKESSTPPTKIDQTKKKDSGKGGWFSSSKKNANETKASPAAAVSSEEVIKAEKEMSKLREEYVPIDFASYTIDDQTSEVLSKRTSEDGLSKDQLE